MQYGRVEPVRVDAGPAWSCPACVAPDQPRETPAGVFCPTCRTKITNCCEGAPLPEGTD